MSDRFYDKDLAISLEGDLILSSDGDLAIVEDMAYISQCIYSRLQSVAKDWFHDNIGADIEASMGKPNTEVTSNELRDRITVALTGDNFCSFDDVIVMAIPTSDIMTVVGVFVNTDLSPEPLAYTIELSFLTGFAIKRVS